MTVTWRYGCVQVEVWRLPPRRAGRHTEGLIRWQFLHYSTIICCSLWRRVDLVLSWGKGSTVVECRFEIMNSLTVRTVLLNFLFKLLTFLKCFSSYCTVRCEHNYSPVQTCTFNIFKELVYHNKPPNSFLSTILFNHSNDSLNYIFVSKLLTYAF